MRTFKEIKQIDTIILNKDISEIEEDLNNLCREAEKENISFYFPLELGVLRINFVESNLNNYFYFLFNSESDSVEVYLYNKNEITFQWILDFRIIGANKTGIEYKPISHNNTIIDKKSIASASELYVQMFQTAMIYALFIKDNPKIKYKKSKSISPNGNPSSQPVKSKTSIILGDKVIYEVNSSKDNLKNFKVRKKHTDSWTVMAFQRKLKSGKTVMVKSHTRGAGTSKIKKEYIIR